MRTLTTQYAEFTPDERLRLTLAAHERGDLTDVDRLIRSCPQESRVVADPRYIVRFLALYGVVRAAIIQWMEVSMLVVLNRLAFEDLSATDVALRAKATAAWKTSSAVWWGIESGFSTFCADAELTCDQLLGVAGGRPLAVEIAGRALHPDARADDGCAEAVRQRLWEVWQSGNKP